MNIFFNSQKPEDLEIGDAWIDQDQQLLCMYDGVSIQTLHFPPDERAKNITEEDKKYMYINDLLKEGFTEETAEIIYNLTLEDIK